MSLKEFCVSYNVSDFDATASFYTDILNFTASVSWDRADGRGAFFIGEGNGVVQIFAAARNKETYDPPPPGSFMIVLIVDNIEAYLDLIVSNGAEVRWPIEKFEWGKYFGLIDPNGVRIYFMERLGENIAIASAALREAVMKR